MNINENFVKDSMEGGEEYIKYGTHSDFNYIMENYSKFTYCIVYVTHCYVDDIAKYGVVVNNDNIFSYYSFIGKDEVDRLLSKMSSFILNEKQIYLNVNGMELYICEMDKDYISFIYATELFIVKKDTITYNEILINYNLNSIN